MDIEKQQALNIAAKKRGEARRYQADAERKHKQAKSLLDKARSQGRGGRLFSLGGPAGKLASSGIKHQAKKNQREAETLQKEAKSLIRKAESAESEAQIWDSKAF